MINMFMADENKDVLKLLQLFRVQLHFRGKLPVFSAPVVKDSQRAFACNGKTAVIVMGDQQILFHEKAHLHGDTNSILCLFCQRVQDKISI